MGNNISPLFDTIARNDTLLTAVKVQVKDKPGKFVAVFPLADGIRGVRKDVQIISSFSTSSQIHLSRSAG